MKVSLFTNFSQTRFASPRHPSAPGKDEHCQWNKVPYSFEPGQSAYLEVGVARTLAHHLITRELHGQGFDSIRGRVRDTGPDPLADQRIGKDKVDMVLERCLGPIIEVSNEVEMQQLTQAMLMAKAAEAVAKKSEAAPIPASQPEVPAETKKRGCKPKAPEASKEAEFEGLTQ